MKLAIAVLVIAAIPTASLAQAPDIREVGRQCEAAVEAGEELGFFVDQILSATSPLRGDEQRLALNCLEAHFGEKYYYSRVSRAFTSETERAALAEAAWEAGAAGRERLAALEAERAAAEAAAEAAAQAAEAAAEAAAQAAEEAALEVRMEAAARLGAIRREYALRLHDACHEKLAEDPFEALTEPMCVQVFESSGFRPDP